MQTPIYLDNNASTRVDPSVLEAMLPYFTTDFANPTNVLHLPGRTAAAAIELARSQVASAIGAESSEITFTSGATESNNIAILGVARRAVGRFRHIITSSIEHSAVLEPCRQLEREGFRVSYLPVDSYGRVDPALVEQEIGEETFLVSVMAANNEVGSLQPVAEIGSICRNHGVLFHTDAAQALGRIRTSVDDWGADLLSISAHKHYGPKGAGALYVRKGASQLLSPLQYGGHQEHGLRPGTPAVPLIVGLGAACHLASTKLDEDQRRLEYLRESLRAIITDAIPDAVVNGHPLERLSGLLSLGFPNLDGDLLVHDLDRVAVSQGSSCSSGSFRPSHVLLAMGLPDSVLRSTIRFGIGRFTTEQEVEKAGAYVIEAVKRQRAL
ncbi:MAG: cysteine desulfurase [Gemmataceae bacterium]|nr:cysteine desulfurase [Gemmataceae bacterium]